MRLPGFEPGLLAFFGEIAKFLIFRQRFFARTSLEGEKGLLEG